jgi:ferredoxin, 2Fe-2S
MQIRFIEAAGEEHVVQARPGMSAMEAAVQNGVPGIDGDCGGNAACGTCHVMVDRAWTEAVGTARSDHEEAMMEIIEDVRDNSRLSCQIALSEDLDGLVLHLPEAQF